MQPALLSDNAFIDSLSERYTETAGLDSNGLRTLISAMLQPRHCRITMNSVSVFNDTQVCVCELQHINIA